MSKKTTEPFKVTCKLMDGRINSMDGLLFLDAILYHAWFLKYAPEVYNGTERKEDHKNWKYHFGLPLTQFHTDNGIRYAASCGFYRQYEHHIEYWNKRPDFTNGKNEKYLEAKGKIDTVAGALKAYHYPQIIRTVSDIEFYGVGTIEKIRDLLSYISAVGKKPATGWGMVREWIVEPFTEDWSTVGKYGLMRPMPVEEYETGRQDYKIMQCALLPPYWKNKNIALCYIPNVIIDEESPNKESGIVMA